MEEMVFRSFIWPQNPEQLKHSCVREPVYTRDEQGNSVFSGMGEGKLTITGSGAFSGKEAYDNFRKLMALFEDGECGSLQDPAWGECNAYLTELELTQQPRKDYVGYRFKFTRANAGGEIPK